MAQQFTFVMEQTLGHVAFTKNLQWAAENDSEVSIDWLPVQFQPQSRLENLPVIRNNWSLRGSLQARRTVNATRKTQGWPDLYLFHTQVISLLSSGWLPKDIPVVVSLDATPINYDQVGLAYGHSAGSGAVEKFKFWLNQRAFKKATYLVTWSEWTRQSLINDYGVDGSKVEVVPPGTNLALWQTQTPKQMAEDKKLRLLFVGGDFERKGGKLLYESYRKALSDKYELHLVTQGQVEEGNGVQVYRNLKPNTPELQNLFREADVFVLPTQGDCLPVAITEAMAAGLPVVSTDVGAIKEAVVPGENGFVIKPEDGTDLIRNLLQLADNRELRLQMGVKGRVRAETKFDASKNGKRILEICKTLACRHPVTNPSLANPITQK